MRRGVTDRPPTPPGEIRLHEFIEPLALSQSKVAEAIGVSFQRFEVDPENWTGSLSGLFCGEGSLRLLVV